MLGPFLPMGGPAPSSWPPNPDALALWLDAFDMDLTGNSSFANNDPIALWKNKGYLGAASNVSASAGQELTFKATGANGHPAALGGVGKKLAGTAELVPSNAARHIFMVAEISASTGGFFMATRGSAGGGYAVQSQSDIYQIETDSATTNNWTTALPAAGIHIIEWSFDGVTTNKCTFTVDGVPFTVVNGVGTGVGSETAGAGCLVLWECAAHLGDLMFYDEVQSSDIALAVRTGLAAKYGVTI